MSRRQISRSRRVLVALALAAPVVLAAPRPSLAALPPAAVPFSPNGAVSTNEPQYTWLGSNVATWYYLWVNDSSGTTKITQWYRASDLPGCTGGPAGLCSVTPSTPLANGAATWWIQTWNADGYGPWSNGQAFTVTGEFPASGTTLRGDYTINFPAGTTIAEAAFSFGFTLPSAPAAPADNFIAANNVRTTTNCPGSATNPQAAPGQLCVYESINSLNRNFGCIFSIGTGLCNQADPWGAGISINSLGGAGQIISRGTWALTVP